MQIYKNTTESIQTFTRGRRLPLWVELLGLALLCGVFYLGGYFIASHNSTPCSAVSSKQGTTKHSKSLNKQIQTSSSSSFSQPPYLSIHDPTAFSSSASAFEDSTIRERLKAELTKSLPDFGRLVREYSAEAHAAGSAADQRLAAKVYRFFEDHSGAFERPTMKNYSVQLSLPDEEGRRANAVSLVDNTTGAVLFSSLTGNGSQHPAYTGGYSLFSPAGNVTVSHFFSVTISNFSIKS